jgi:hypothetical protein
MFKLKNLIHYFWNNHWTYTIKQTYSQIKSLNFKFSRSWKPYHIHTLTPPTTLTYLLTPWNRVLLEKLTGSAASHEIPRILRKPKVHYRTHKCPPPLPVMSQLHPVSTTHSHFLKIHLNIIIPSMSRSPHWSLSLRPPPQNPVHTSPFPHTCHMPRHLILLDFTTRTILGKDYITISSSLCNFLHSPVTSSLFGPNNCLNTLFSNTLSLRSSLNVSDQVSHPHRRKGKIIILYIYWNS